MKIDVARIRKQLLNGKLQVDDLDKYQNDLKLLASTMMNKKVLTHEEFEETRDLLMILLDFYTYSSTGDVIVTDNEYDKLMNHYIDNGGKPISKADNLVGQTQWDFIAHEAPGMVGTVKKAYTFDELVHYMSKYRSSIGKRRWMVAPKFDGISSAIKIDSSGKILLGVTRNNGIEGQDITKVVKNAFNANILANAYASKLKKGEIAWIKTELCMSTDSFNELTEHKKYKNRRSATSGIVNSPKNVAYAKYITIIPLATYYMSSETVEYSPMDSKEFRIDDPFEMMEVIEELLSRIRDARYEFRTDGVVLYPIGDDVPPNFNDIMDDAIAYKVNTAQALTPVDFGYVSVGRLGFAVPMLHVHPVEVNETTVTDVSLGSFDKFVNMDIHEGEQVLVYSAGDVIPQAKLPEERYYKESAPLLKIKKRCPYCGEKLQRHAKGQYRCTNEDCPRIKSGRIVNFISKLKAENVSDKTIDDLVENKLIEDIPDLFKLKKSDIAVLKGYGEDSANIIINEINKIRNKEIPVSSLIGALGITGISEKKCQKLFKVMTLREMLKKKPDELTFILVSADNTGHTTAETFSYFIHENKKLIKSLLELMNVITDIEWKGNVVFTGFRNPELEKKFNEIHYEVSNNVNGRTRAVIDASFNHDSTKCKAARRKGIDVVHVSEADDVLKGLRKEVL